MALLNLRITYLEETLANSSTHFWIESSELCLISEIRFFHGELP